MKAALVLALAVLAASVAGAATVDPAEAWKPIYPFIGTWKATHAGEKGAVKVTRVVAASPTNHHLEITESGGHAPGAVRGTVSLDPQRQVLVLREFAPDGSAADVPLDPAATAPGEVVFTSPETDAIRTRVTFQRVGANDFVERIEHAGSGEPFALVSETRFVRAD